jgi:hypothetical protein
LSAFGEGKSLFGGLFDEPQSLKLVILPVPAIRTLPTAWIIIVLKSSQNILNPFSKSSWCGSKMKSERTNLKNKTETTMTIKVEHEGNSKVIQTNHHGRMRPWWLV